jgi:hypothetical protein
LFDEVAFAACSITLQAAYQADRLLARGRVVPATARWISSGAGPACGFAHIECHLVSPKVPFEFLRESGFGSRQNRDLAPSMRRFLIRCPKNHMKNTVTPSTSLRDAFLWGGVTADFSDLHRRVQREFAPLQQNKGKFCERIANNRSHPA